MTAPWSYLLCATPRTGSTLLCSLLSSTGVAGRPESYFREQDERAWAVRLGVPIAGDGSFDYLAFGRAAARAGRTSSGVFGARIMWGTMRPLVDGLRADGSAENDLEVLSDTFGPLHMVHLYRNDVVEQAVSWARAEQTGYWHSGDVAAHEPVIDLDVVDHLVRTIEVHNAAWLSWFAAQGVQPYRLTYEELSADPGRAIRSILDYLGIEPPTAWHPEPEHRKQADKVSADWVRRYRSTRL